MNPWAIIGVLILWAASLAGVGYWQNEAGQTQVRADWLKKDNKELTTANNKIKQMEEDARRTEHRWAQNQADISTLLQKEKENAKRKTDQLIADYRAGTFSLRDPGTRSKNTGTGAGGPTAPSASGCDGATPGELSGTAAEFLLGLTGEADAVAHQLAACQAVIVSDRSIP